MAIADGRLRDLRNERLCVAEQKSAKRAGLIEFLQQQIGFQSQSAAALCTTARLGVEFPPINIETPTMSS